VLQSEGGTTDGRAIEELKNTIDQHHEKFPMETFSTKRARGDNNSQGSKRERPDGDLSNPGIGGGAGGVRATDCAELRAHAYEKRKPLQVKAVM